MNLKPNEMKYCFFMMLLLFAACGKQAENAVEIVVYDAASTIDVLDIGVIEHVEILPLETHDDILIGDSPELLIVDNDYYVIDKTGNKVLRFDGHGRFMNAIGRMGRGASEFIAIKKATIVDDALCVYSSLNEAEYMYSKDGLFIRKTKVPYLAQQILHRDNESLFYLGYKNQYGTDRVIAVDNSGKIIHKYLPSSANILTMVEDYPILIPSGESVFVKETINNDIYSIDGVEVKIAYRFDYGEYNIPAEYFKMNDPYKAGEYLFSRGFASHSLFLINKSLVVLQSIIKKTDGITLAYAFKDKASGKWTWCNYSMTDESDRDNVFAGSLKQLTDSDIYFMVEPHKLIKSNLRNSPLVSNPEIIDSLNENDNYVILKCGLKEL